MNADIMKDLEDLDDDEQENDVDQGDGSHSEEQDHINAVEKLISTKIEANDIKASFTKDRNEEASIIHKCNQYAAEIDRQISFIVKYVKREYNKRLPELEGIVTAPAIYCKALLEIEEGNSIVLATGMEAETQKKPFQYLNSQQSISLRMAISSPHEDLKEPEKSRVLAAARQVTLLHEHQNLLMMYLESCMQIVAPNLCKLVGSAVASKLISTAGGIDKLSFMPACNIQVMGGSRSASVGLSQLERNHTGIFGQLDIVKSAPRKFQMQLVRMLATNTAKCARADFLGTSATQGQKLRDDMLERFQKVQEEGGLLRVQRPLPIPDEAPKKKRGGKRYRKMKELYQMSELSKHKNRVKFGEAEEEIEQGVGLGMLKTGIGKLNVKIKKQNLNPSKKMQQRINQQKRTGMGIESSLDLASNQGIELINPSVAKEINQRRGTQSYFNREAGFKTILNQKMGK